MDKRLLQVQTIQKIKKRARLFILLSVVSLIILAAAPVLLLRATGNLYSLVSNPHLQRLSYNLFQANASLSKSLNITHLPYWFWKTELPVFEITISPKNLRVMDDSLPKEPYTGRLGNDNKVFVSAFFTSGAYASEIDVRYRGRGSSHWINSKRSLLVKFPKENLFNGIKSFDLIVPKDRSYLGEITQNDHIKRAGLVPKNMFFVRVRINNQDAGVYVAKERFGKQWLEKNGIPDASEVFSQSSDPSADTPTVQTDLLSPEKYWRRDIHTEISSFDELETLFALLDGPGNEVFEKNIATILDLEKWYKAVAINVFAGKAHSMVGNLNLLFNSSTGRFEPLLEDVHIYKVGPEIYSRPEDIYDGFELITKRILSNKEFYKEYLQVLKEVVSEKEVLLDLEFYDYLYSKLQPEFYKDQTKYKNDKTVMSTIDKMRSAIKENYKNAQYLAGIEDYPMSEAEQAEKPEYSPDVPESFRYLFDVTATPDEFVSKHPEFKTQNNEIVLPRGAYTLNKNIIIPRNTKLTIEAGAKIYLSKGVSIVSYSPMIAVGSQDKPIFIGRKKSGENWGTIAVINTEKRSEFRYVTMVGGSSSEAINGVTFTGMLSAHNAPLYVFDSQFYKDGDDDAINAKYSTGEISRSQFFDSMGDAIDLDMTNDFVVDSNLFSNIGTGPEGGDAIDISFSNPRITNNTVNGCGDKGVSAGEKSTPLIESNSITGCVIGIAVKDYSKAAIKNNEIAENNEGLSLYQKKAIFGGGEAELEGNEFLNNGINVKTDDLSSVTYKGTN